MFNT
jgi:hypothetical protein